MPARQTIPSQYTSPPQPLPCRGVHVIPLPHTFLLISHVHGDTSIAASASLSCSKGKIIWRWHYLSRMLPLWVTQSPLQTNTCRWIHKPERQWRICPKCIQPFCCMTMKRVSLVQSWGNITTHFTRPSFFFFLNVHKLAGACRCQCQQDHQNSQPGWPLSISKAGVSIKPSRCSLQGLLESLTMQIASSRGTNLMPSEVQAANFTGTTLSGTRCFAHVAWCVPRAMDHPPISARRVTHRSCHSNMAHRVHATTAIVWTLKEDQWEDLWRSRFQLLPAWQCYGAQGALLPRLGACA